MRWKWQLLALIVICLGQFEAAFGQPHLTSISPTSGPVGTTVTIKGTGLGTTRGTVTFFNSQTVTPPTWTTDFTGTTTIVVAVPPLATTGNVYATTAGGTNSVNSLLFTVLPPLVYAARTDMCETGNNYPIPQQLPSGNAQGCNNSATTGQQGALLSYLGRPTDVPPAPGTTSSGNNLNGLASYLYATNSSETSLSYSISDPDFGTTMYRATDYSFNTGQHCTSAAGGAQTSLGVSFSMGSGGGPGSWAIDESKLLVINTDSVNQLLAFNPYTGVVTPTPICGSGITGSAGTSLSQTSPQIIYRLNADEENTVTFTGSISGTCQTPETVLQTGTSATALLLAVNPTFVQMGPVTGSANSTAAWTGQSSHCSFNPSGSAPGAGVPAIAIYKGTICDGVLCGSTTPSTWYVQYSLLFDFDYVSGMGAPYFPTGANTCMPAGYFASYTGQFGGSNDDSEFTVVVSDTGQVNRPGGSCPKSSSSTGGCTGPVYVVSYTAGQGCRVLNSWTNTIVGDWGPGSPGPTQPVIGQQYYVNGTISGTFALNGEELTQKNTGATTQLQCTGSIQSVGITGSSDTQFVCSTSSPNAVLIGMIYTATADASDEWCAAAPPNGSGACITPAGGNFAPIHPPFYFPDVLHDQSQTPNAQVTSISWVQQGNAKISNVAYNASSHQTTITFPSAGAPIYSATSTGFSIGAQQLQFYNLAGANDQYLNCTSQNQCPVWNIVTGTTKSGSTATIVISDTQGGGSNYSDAESQSGCSASGPTYCPLFAPEGQGTNGGNATVGYGFQSNPNYWQTQTLIINTCTAPGCQGHAAGGYINDYRAKQYSVYNILNPSTPCTTTGLPGGSPYQGPLSPCPNADTLSLLPVPITDDQHGTYNNRGTTDLPPVAMSTTLVCGQPSGAGSIPCEYDQNLGTVGSCPIYGGNCTYVPYGYQSVWDNELIAIQNWITGAASCTYNPPNSNPSGCVYRLGHSFATMNSWNFNAQNAIGIMSNDGNWIAFPSDWDLTEGCMDGTTNCWDSWTATQNTASASSVTVTTNNTGTIVTIGIPNNFCPTSGQQYYYISGSGTGTGLYPVNCGSTPGQVTITGFSESWLEGSPPDHGLTVKLGSNTSNSWCPAANCYTGSNAGNYTYFTAIDVTGAPANYSATETGTQNAAPVACAAGVPCQRSDIWVAHVTTAHQ
jgi:hypothetical protein